MKVKELIEKLQEFDGDTQVVIEYDSCGTVDIFNILNVNIDGDYSEECTYEHVVLEAVDISW